MNAYNGLSQARTTSQLTSIEVARGSARGSLILFLGTFLSTAVSAAAVLFIARLLGPDAYGRYTLALVLPSTLMLFGGLGIDFAVTRYVAYFLSRGETARARELAKRAIRLTLLLGAFLAAVNYFSSPYLAGTLLHREDLAPLMQLGSVFMMGQTMAFVTTSAFVGWNSMTEVSVLSVVQPVLKLVLVTVLILSGLGIYGAVVGHVTSVLAQGGIGLLVLYAVKLGGPGEDLGSLRRDLKMMIGYGFPLFAGSLMAGLASQYITVILASIASNEVIGYYAAAANVSTAITIISGTLSTVLFRSFATLDGLQSNFTSEFDYAIRYVSYLLTPIIIFLTATAAPMVSIFYSQVYSPSAPLLQLFAIANLPVVFGLSVIPSFLGGIGKSRAVMLLSLTGAVVWVVTGTLLSVSLGLGAQGIIIGSLFSNAASCTLGLYLSLRHTGVRVVLRPLIGIVAACFLSWGLVSLVPQGSAPALLTLLVDAAIFLAVYLTTAPLFRGVSLGDVERLLAITEGLWLVGAIMRVLLNYEKWLLRLSQRSNNVPISR